MPEKDLVSGARTPLGGSRPRSRSPWAISTLALLVSLLGLSCLGLIIHSLNTRQLDPKGCRMSYMRPLYARLDEFDTEHTRFASKYSLYLYREQYIDDDTKLRGIPVLFIPGNAGSYKQVRPIAAEAATLFHEEVQHDAAAIGAGARALDFFTVDFNEDFTAFHGQTLLDQAEYLNEAIRYILSLYLDPRMSGREPGLPDPTSVIVLGHSMGGIVARTMLTIPNYQSNSINSIITMAAPHARPPVSFDGQIVDIYREINDYWRRAYAQPWAPSNPLSHVTLISIAGGGLDTIVPSDYASIESLVPETHGFTVFTSSIPTVWTSMDHQAIMWCDQFRKVVAHALYDIIDVNRPAQTKPRAERMRAFKRRFLTGLEAAVEKAVPLQEPSTLLTLDDSNAGSIIAQGERLVLRRFGTAAAGGRPQAHLLPVPPPGTPAGKRLTLLTDQHLDRAGDNGRLEVLLCSVFPTQPAGQAGVTQFAIKMDLSGDSAGSTRLACKNAASDVILLPTSTRSARHPFYLEDEPELLPFSYLEFDVEDIADHQYVAIIDKASSPTAGFVVAEFSDRSQSHRVRNISLRSLLAFGMDLQLPASRPMVNEVRIPSIRSSLLAYNLEIGQQTCGGGDGGSGAEMFTPLVRQFLSEPHESKFFVNVRRASVSLHGVAPYVPPPMTPKPAGEEGLGFQFWTDPTCDSTVQVRLSIDVLGSLGKLYMRYRTVFAAFPLLVVALVLREQFNFYDAKGVFLPFTEALDMCLRRSIPLMLAGLTILSMCGGGTSGSSSRQQTSNSRGGFWNSGGENATLVSAIVNYQQNDLLIGTGDPVFWFMVPLIGLVCIGACTVLNYAALCLTQLLATLMGLLSIRPAWGVSRWRRHSNDNYDNDQTPLVDDQGTMQQQPHHQQDEQGRRRRQQQQQQQRQQEQQQLRVSSRQGGFASCPSGFGVCSPRRRVLTTAVLLFLVATFIPYQFAYVVACLVQLTTTVRALRIVSDAGGRPGAMASPSPSTSSSPSPNRASGGHSSHHHHINYNFYNYAHSTLVLMLWVLPINLPTLVVWVRNLAVHWLTPFSSHHNVLSIIPFIVLVETQTTGRMVPRVRHRWRRASHLSGALFLAIAVYAAVYGVSYAYVLHQLVNLVAAWLVIVHSTAASVGGGPGSWSLASLGLLFDNDERPADDRKRGKIP
ncbi:GPI inositol-deacylase [Magnaporthiopsis poae ATCC 64411]|uniref:GPI inositol-deacylase n=1 Tax=Magnaporthiopsis poae (strain ATCC 64411 / 73-15) TaxID=644358 RepID=A0A0C4DYA5_MAGP6|nr:GPI inositol-deacylase [Magnaporthiopsis poae ATCC 64411]